MLSVCLCQSLVSLRKSIPTFQSYWAGTKEFLGTGQAVQEWQAGLVRGAALGVHVEFGVRTMLLVWQSEFLEDSALETRAGEEDSAHGRTVWLWEPGKGVDRQEQGGQGCVSGCRRSSMRNSLGTRRKTRGVYRLCGSFRSDYG